MPYADPEVQAAYLRAYRKDHRESINAKARARGWPSKRKPDADLKRKRSGAGTLNENGYRLITVDGQQVREHRYVMEQFLGRSLLPTEHVHHRDGNKLNNDISNLVLTDIREHNRYHSTFRSATHKQCTRCGQIKERQEFYRCAGPKHRDTSNHDPHLSRCITCHAELYQEKKRRDRLE